MDHPEKSMVEEEKVKVIDRDLVCPKQSFIME